MKLTEDQTVNYLVAYLERNGWTINDFKLGFDRGPDIDATKNDRRLLVEVKGARAGDSAHNKVRSVFDSGQIKSHFGRALVKALALKHEFADADIALAHPDDPEIRRHIGNLVPFLNKLDVKHFWVTEDKVTEG